MAFTSLSPEVVSAQIMRDLGLSNVVVSALTGIEKTRLGYAIRQVRALDNDEAKVLKDLLLRLQEISRALHPLSFDSKNVPNLRTLLKALEGVDEKKIAARVRVLLQGDGFDE